MKHFLRWACVLLCVGSLFVACTREKTSSIAPALGKVGTTDIPYYFDREITDKDLQGRTLRELSLMRNTIYARAGNEFSRKWLHEYFTAQPWYKETGYDDTKISKLDRKNAETIAKREAGMSKNELKARRDVLHRMKDSGQWNDALNVELGLISHALGETVDWDPSLALRNPLESPGLLGKLITVQQVQDFSRRDLRILRNMIYARHGRPFVSEILQEYFGRMAWYKVDPTYTDKRLTALDKKNIKIVLSMEQHHGGPLSEEEHAREAQSDQEDNEGGSSAGWMSGA
jgi:hypothetical protein